MSEFEIFIKTLRDYITVNLSDFNVEEYKNYANNLYKAFGPFTLDQFQESGLQEGYWSFLMPDAPADELENNGQEEGEEVLQPPLPQEGFVNSQIWEYEGQKYVVWKVPGTEFYMRYNVTDTQLSQFYSGRQMPITQTATTDMWANSVYFGYIQELPERVLLQGENPFIGFTEQLDAAYKASPHLAEDKELLALWIEGLVEDRDITDYEWEATDWFTKQPQERIDWLVLSRGKGINADDLPADAQVLRDENRVLWRAKLISAGVDGVDTIVDANGVSFAEWFADQVTQGIQGFSDTLADAQIIGLADSKSGIEVNADIKNWLDGKKLGGTRTGQTAAQNTAYKWLGPLYGKLDSASLEEAAGIYRNAESDIVGQQLLDEKYKAMRKSLFGVDVYDENMTYEDIATPWRNFVFNFLGERMPETTDAWLSILKANDQTEANKILTIFGLNNDNKKVLDTVTDEMATSVGVRQGVVRGQPT